MPYDGGIIADNSLGPIQDFGSECIDPSVLSLDNFSRNSNGQGSGDGNCALTYSSISSPFDIQNFSSDWATYNPALAVELPDSSYQSISTNNNCFAPVQSGSHNSPRTSSTSLESISTLSSDSAAARNNTTSIALPPLAPAKPTKEQIQASTTFPCAICNKSFGTNAAYTRHVSKHLRCEFAGCNKVFTSNRGRQRHYETKAHRDSKRIDNATNTYQCRCGKRQPSSRKDNHRRHLAICKKNATTHFHCPCGVKTAEEDKHLAHLATCIGQKR